MTFNDSSNLQRSSDALKLEPEDLDGHTIDELSDYLDTDRNPANPSIDQSPGSQIALRALAHLRAVSQSLLAADMAANTYRDDSWIHNIMDSIGMEARAGRNIPFAHTTPDAELIVTEGALRGVIRTSGDNVEGALIGRVKLDGDITALREPITVLVNMSVLAGQSIPDTVDLVRAAVWAELMQHSELQITSIDITVQHLFELPPGTSEESP